MTLGKFHLGSMKGTILVVALFIMVLLEVTVVALLVSHRTEIRHSNNYLSSQKAIQLALSEEAKIKDLIYTTTKLKKEVPLGTLSKNKNDDAFIEIALIDVQGRFNLNNLVNSDSIDGFKNMMRAISAQSFEMSDEIIQKAQSNVNVSPDTMPEQGNQLPFASATQLRPLPKMTAEHFNKILPYLFALPAVVPLNVNTATEYSLMSLDPNITITTAQSIIKMRKNMNGFKQIEAFLSLAPLQGIEVNTDMVTIQSQFYLAKIRVNYQSCELTLYSLLGMGNQPDNSTGVSVYWRSFEAV